jgi:hypothetical protein
MEVVQIASGIQFSEDEDAIFWQYTSSGKYSVQSLYAIVNNRGVQQVFTPAVWKIPVPSRLHVFLWLLANNKVLTRNNLAKRREVDDKTCLFCNEVESVVHLFFECCVAKSVWKVISEITGLPTIKDFESLGSMWVRGKKIKAFNVCSTAVIWTIWKTRNNMCFQGQCWIKVELLLHSRARMLRNWKLVNKPEEGKQLEAWALELDRRGARPPQLMWGAQSSGSSAFEAVNVLSMPSVAGSQLLSESSVFRSVNLNVMDDVENLNSQPEGEPLGVGAEL